MVAANRGRSNQLVHFVNPPKNVAFTLHRISEVILALCGLKYFEI